MHKWKKNSLFLIILIIVGIIMGIIFANVLNSTDEKMVITKITNYFNNLKEDIPIKYWDNFLTNWRNNVIYLIIIWILGLSIIGLLLNNFLLFFKSFIMGFSIGSIINIYFYKGIVLAFLYIFPSTLINLFIYLIMTYYANDFSWQLFHVLFLKKEYKFDNLIKNYFKLLGLLLIILIISTLLETFLTPFLIKLFSFLITK